MTTEPLLALVGPTATGKTEAGLSLAQWLGCEILSVDSMVIYRGMDIGTAKPTPEQRAIVPHHLVDLADPSEPFSVARFQRAAARAIEDVSGRSTRPLLVGGSGLYFRAIVDDLRFPGTDPTVRSQLERESVAVGARALHRRLAHADPTAAARIEPGNVRRTVRALEVAAITGRPFSSFARQWEIYGSGRVRVVGVTMSREVLGMRVRSRVGAMLDAGLLGEVARHVEGGLGGWLTSTQAIGYAEFARHLQGTLSLEDAVEATVKRTRQLARRQLAWFRRDPRIHWVEAGPEGAIGVVGDARDLLGAA